MRGRMTVAAVACWGIGLVASAQGPSVTPALSADQQIMVDTLTALWKAQTAACAELPLSQSFQAQATRVIQQIQQGQAGHTATLQVRGDALVVQWTPK